MMRKFLLIMLAASLLLAVTWKLAPRESADFLSARDTRSASLLFDKISGLVSGLLSDEVGASNIGLTRSHTCAAEREECKEQAFAEAKYAAAVRCVGDRVAAMTSSRNAGFFRSSREVRLADGSTIRSSTSEEAWHGDEYRFTFHGHVTGPEIQEDSCGAPQPDLVIRSLVANPDPGGSFNLTATVMDQLGGQPEPVSAELRFYSSRRSETAKVTEIRSEEETISIKIGEEKKGFSIPHEESRPGVYLYGACVKLLSGTIEEYNERNNCVVADAVIVGG